MPQDSELGVGKHWCDLTLDTTSFVVVVSPSLKHGLNTSDDDKIPISPNLIPWELQIKSSSLLSSSSFLATLSR